MIVFGLGIFTVASKMFLQQGLTDTPRTVWGVSEQLCVELPGVGLQRRSSLFHSSVISPIASI
jgi:hypothetical protein